MVGMILAEVGGRLAAVAAAAGMVEDAERLFFGRETAMLLGRLRVVSCFLQGG